MSKKGLKSRFVFFVTSLIVFMACSFLISTVSRERSLLIKNIVGNTRIKLQLLTSAVEQLPDDSERISRIADILLHTSSIYSLKITNAASETLYEAMKPEFDNQKVLDYDELSKFKYIFSLPDYFSLRETLASGISAELAISLIEVKSKILDTITDNIILSSVIAAFGFFIAVFLSEIVVRPVDKLIKAVQTISAGDYTQRISLDSENEIKLLAHEINLMAANLEKTIDSAKFISLGRLSASIAHEIRTPLVSIGSLIQLWQKDPDMSKYSEDMTVILKEVTRLNNVVNQLLSYARPQQGNKKPVVLNRIIEEILLLLKPSAHKSSIKIFCHYGTIGEILLDEEKTKQIFLNLIMNAIQAMKEGGELTIVTGSAETGIFARICDTGPGIPEEIADNLFEPFVTGKQGGTGLGLSIAKNLTELQNGNILLEKNSSQGVCFLVTFRYHEKEI